MFDNPRDLRYNVVTMMMIDDDGQELQVPERIVGPVRWLIMEAAQVVQDASCNFKIIISLGRGGAPSKTVIERHQVL